MDTVLNGPAAGTESDTAAGVDFGPYMMLADDRLNIYSVFDDLKYDRADADLMTPAMRAHALLKLKPIGFRQVSGGVLKDKARDIVCYIPRPQVLGASPFDITRYTPKRERDFYLLTPTQTACRFIDAYPFEVAFEKISAMVTRQPINLLRLMDFLERKPAHDTIREALGHFKWVQDEAVRSEPLRRRRALG